MAEMSLSALVEMQPHGRIVAAKAIYVQTAGRLQLGHELNMFTEKAWTGLKKAAQDDARYSPFIRCMDCNAIGSLDEWLLMLNGCCGKWDRYKAKLDATQLPRLQQVESKCDRGAFSLAVRYISELEEG